MFVCTGNFLRSRFSTVSIDVYRVRVCFYIVFWFFFTQVSVTWMMRSSWQSLVHIVFLFSKQYHHHHHLDMCVGFLLFLIRSFRSSFSSSPLFSLSLVFLLTNTFVLVLCLLVTSLKHRMNCFNDTMFVHWSSLNISSRTELVEHSNGYLSRRINHVFKRITHIFA